MRNLNNAAVGCFLMLPLTGYNTGKPRTTIQIQGLLKVPIVSTEVSYSLPYLPPLHYRPPRRVLPVKDGHQCYVDADWQGSYFLVPPTRVGFTRESRGQTLGFKHREGRLG